MDRLTFFANVIDSLAWPLAVILFVLLMKEKIKYLMDKIIQLKLGSFEITLFKEESKKFLSHQSPLKSNDIDIMKVIQEIKHDRIKHHSEIVFDSWELVEKSLYKAVSQLNNSEFNKNKGSYNALRILEDGKKIDASLSGKIRELKQLRDVSSHIPRALITEQVAYVYAAVAEEVVKELESSSSKGN